MATQSADTHIDGSRNTVEPVPATGVLQKAPHNIQRAVDPERESHTAG
jgi:hypothetical protein